MRQVSVAAIAVAALASAGCATTGGDKEAAVRIDKDPYPSTYQRYPGTPTLIRGATVLDGEGGRIEGGEVLLADGKIVAVGRDLKSDGATVIDGTGKYVTPGIIDVHSHLGDYPSRSPRTRTATKPPGQPDRKSGLSTVCGRRILVSAGRWPMAASPRCKSCRAPLTSSAAAR